MVLGNPSRDSLTVRVDEVVFLLGHDRGEVARETEQVLTGAEVVRSAPAEVVDADPFVEMRVFRVEQRSRSEAWGKQVPTNDATRENSVR